MIFFYFKLRVTWNELSRFLRRNFFQHSECSVELDGRVCLLPKSTETNPLPKITLEDPYSEMVGVIMVLRCCCSINSRNASNLRIWYWQNPFKSTVDLRVHFSNFAYGFAWLGNKGSVKVPMTSSAGMVRFRTSTATLRPVFGVLKH